MIEKTKEGELNLNRASAPEHGGKVWRLVHDGKQVLAVFETSGQTETIHEVVDFDTESELEAGIEALGLDNTDPHGIDSRPKHPARRHQPRHHQT